MNKENVIFNEIKELRKELEVLTIHSDSELWGKIYNKIDESYKILLKDKRIYGW